MESIVNSGWGGPIDSTLLIGYAVIGSSFAAHAQSGLLCSILSIPWMRIGEAMHAILRKATWCTGCVRVPEGPLLMIFNN